MCRNNEYIKDFGYEDFVKNYMSSGQYRCTDWLDCSALSKYYYFVKNSGSGDVEMFIEISPGGSMTFEDSGPYVISPDEVSYVHPMRESRYLRLKYKNLSSENPNLITVWFQGKNNYC
jgi:hypothetical protein